MSDLDDRLDETVRRVADRVDPASAFERVERSKRRLPMVRRARAAVLSVLVIGATAGGVLVLARAFGAGTTTPSDEPTSPPPGVTNETACPQDPADLPPGYEQVGSAARADVTGDGRSSRIAILGDEDRPHRCRYFVRVEHPDGRVFTAGLEGFDWLLDVPALLPSVEIDGKPGLEIVVDFGGPGHPHRTAEILTFHQGELVLMLTEPPGDTPPFLFPLYGEFPAATDCAGDPGSIVVTTSVFAPGGDDSLYGIIRTLMRARGANFVEVRQKRFTVEVGTQSEVWPELADRSFRSCPGG
jgi:hypothetical protein